MAVRTVYGLGGTLVDTAVLLLPKTTSQCPHQLGELVDLLSSLRGVTKESQSAAIIELLSMCSVQERTTLARLLVGARPAQYIQTPDAVAESSMAEQLMVTTILYAHKSQGVSSQTFSHFTLGVKKGDIYVPLAKVANSLDENSNQHVEDFATSRTVEKFGPTHWIAIGIICEVAYVNVEPSTRTKSGIKLKGARLTRWLPDATLDDVGQL